MIFEGSRAAAAQPGRPHKTMVYPTEQAAWQTVQVCGEGALCYGRFSYFS
jgi:hypothetical protein